jgi:peptidoglycan-N-acetylglucosamine deacetylase
MKLLIAAVVSLIVASIGVRGLIWISYLAIFGDTYRHGDTDKKVVALTFDDGPYKEYTEKLLEILEEYQVKATFFMQGRKIERRPHVVQKIHARGHEVGNHSYSHPRMVYKSPSFIRSEIEKTDALLKDLGIEYETHFRTPYGQQLIAVPFVLTRLGKKNIRWSIDPRDQKATGVDQLVSQLMKEVKPGSIILLHDNGVETINAVEMIVKGLKNRGYNFLTISQMMSL